VSKESTSFSALGNVPLALARAAMRNEYGDRIPDFTRAIDKIEPHGILLTLRDGGKAAVLKLGDYSATRWHFAGKLAGERIATPHLNIAYEPRDFRALREMGASWKTLTEAVKEPEGWAARPLRR
jgi:hypothetical protein